MAHEKHHWPVISALQLLLVDVLTTYFATTEEFIMNIGFTCHC